MSTISKNFSQQQQIIGSNDGWVTLSGTNETFSSDVDMVTNGYEGVHMIVEVDYDASPTDDVDVNLYGSLDGANFDNTPFWSVRLDNSFSTQQIGFIVRDMAHFRISVRQTGSTDSHNVRSYIRPWNWESQ